MNTFDVTLGNVNITIAGNNTDEIAETLREHGLEELLYDNFYFSKTQLQRTGEGWVDLHNMNERFIVNAFVARLGESIKSMHQATLNVNNDLTDMYFVGFLQNIVDAFSYTSLIPDENGNHPILQGLVNEIDRRQNVGQNNEFDGEAQDVLSSTLEAELENFATSVFGGCSCN